MADPKDSDKPSAPGNRAGKVRHDASGRAIWEWAVDTGRHAIDSTSRLLKRLDHPDLELEEDAKKREAEKPPEGKDLPTFGGPRETDPAAGSRHSFNPYDNRTPARPASAASKAPSPKPAPASKSPKKPGLIGRLFGRH